MSVLTIVTGTVGISIKDDVMDFTLSTGTVGVNITGEGSLVSVWIVTGSLQGQMIDPVCNIQWTPYVSGTAELMGQWTCYNEFFVLTELGKTIGVWYSQDVPLINTEVGGTPTPNTFFPNTSGTLHFIDYTFTVPTTGYYSVTFYMNNALQLRTTSSIGPGYVLIYDYILDLFILGRHFYAIDTCLDGMNPLYPTMSDAVIPSILLTAGVQYTVKFRVRTRLIQDYWSGSGLPIDWGNFCLWFGEFGVRNFYMRIEGVL